jgi:hypothetical protein
MLWLQGSVLEDQGRSRRLNVRHESDAYTRDSRAYRVLAL